MTYQYIAELGRHPELSLAEWRAVGEAYDVTLRVGARHAAFALIESATELPVGFTERLGGTVRVTTVIHAGEGRPNEDEVIHAVREAVTNQHPLGKRIFGLSSAPLAAQAALPSPAKLRAWGLSIKKLLRTDGSIRLMTATTRLLSPAAITHNNVIGTGGDFILFIDRAHWYLTRTTFVHDFEGQAYREFKRPASDAKSGMLPVQLARILVNLSGKKDGTILDPFCGSGTILTEAMLLGWPRILGSDTSPQAVEAAQANAAWTKKNVPGAILPTITIARAERLAEQLPHASVDAIVTEPSLGPPLRGAVRRDELLATTKQLRTLYRQALSNFHTILKDDGRIVMIFPFFRDANLGTAPGSADLVAVGFDLVSQQRYARPDARVARDILILDKRRRIK